jgi:histo-blood group ABO system transferase
MKIGLLLIATNKYFDFIPPLLEGVSKFFLPKLDVTYFIFTNVPVRGEGKAVITQVEHKPWPWMTLERYKIFHTHAHLFEGMDYLFYCDADMSVVGEVGDEILSERVATLHPGCFLWNPRGEPETNPDSLACIAPEEEIPDCYKCGGFQGGSKEEYLKMSKKISENIDEDYKKGIIAKWHDESHFNRYMLDHPPTKVLDPSYCFAQDYPLPFEPKIIALNKDHALFRAEPAEEKNG